jgi:AraC-like DNA-binding protein
VYLEQGREIRRAGPGELVLVESTRPYLQTFDEPTELIGLRFWSSVLRERGLRHDLRGLIFPDMSTADARAIRDMVVAIAAQHGNTSATLRCRQGEQLLDLIDLLIDDPSSLTRARSGDATLDRAKRFIARNLRTPGLTAPMIAAAVFVSDAHLNRLFKADGQSLMGYVWESRLALAADMLHRSNGSARIGEIAHRCGFSNHAHFSRAFKERFGMTPREAALPAACELDTAA